MLLCIDFQPAYAESFDHTMGALRKRLRKASIKREEVHFIYNEVFSLEGEELGDPLPRILHWCSKERLMLKNTRMIRKNFGWVSHLFRSGYERNVARSILRHLMDKSLSISSEIGATALERIVATSHDDFDGFWDCSPAAWQEINSGAIAMPFIFEGGVIPWIESLRSSLSKNKGEIVEVSGGFRHRCLDEMCLLLEAGEIPYTLNEAIVYSLQDEEPFRAQTSDFPLDIPETKDSIPFLDLGLAIA